MSGWEVLTSEKDYGIHGHLRVIRVRESGVKRDQWKWVVTRHGESYQGFSPSAGEAQRRAEAVYTALCEDLREVSK